MLIQVREAQHRGTVFHVVRRLCTVSDVECRLLEVGVRIWARLGVGVEAGVGVGKGVWGKKPGRSRVLIHRSKAILGARSESAR